MTGHAAWRFAIDRMDVPLFYTAKNADDSFPDIIPDITILAESEECAVEDYMRLGYVSRQTPLGQGTSLLLKCEAVQPADPLMVIASLHAYHPQGRKFRPPCTTFHLIMNGDAANRAPATTFITGAPDTTVHETQHKALKRHRSIMRRWPLITWQQRRAIMKALCNHLTTNPV